MSTPSRARLSVGLFRVGINLWPPFVGAGIHVHARVRAGIHARVGTGVQVRARVGAGIRARVLLGSLLDRALLTLVVGVAGPLLPLGGLAVVVPAVEGILTLVPTAR